MFMFMLCFAIIIIIIIVFPLHVHCIHLARGMMRMRIPSINDIVYTRPVPRHCISADPSFSLLAVADRVMEKRGGTHLWERN